MVQFAFDALLSAQCTYSPVVLSGPTGTGKTLLASGLFACWQRTYPEGAAHFLCGADFARAYSNAVDTDSVNDFRQRFGSAQLFVLDNLDELQRKPAAQQEFILILDELLASRTTVLITTRQQISTSRRLSSMLVSRLAAGLTVPLQPPGMPARRLLLRRLAAFHQVNLPDSVLDLLAKDLGPADNPSTVPELNHAVVQLGHAATTDGLSVNEQMVTSFLARQSLQQKLSLRRIAERAAKHFSVPPEQLRSQSRRQNVVRARGVAIYLCRKLTDKSLKSIGEFFGRRDHTTVMHACRKTEQLYQSDPEISHAINRLLEAFQMR